MTGIVIAAAILALFTIAGLIAKYAPTVGQKILAEAPAEYVEQDRLMADLEQFEQASIAHHRNRGICGASNGDLVCTLKPHDSDRHLDERYGSQYHSATFTTRTGGAA